MGDLNMKTKTNPVLTAALCGVLLAVASPTRADVVINNPGNGDCRPDLHCDVCTPAGVHNCFIIPCNGPPFTFTENCIPPNDGGNNNNCPARETCDTCVRSGDTGQQTCRTIDCHGTIQAEFQQSCTPPALSCATDEFSDASCFGHTAGDACSNPNNSGPGTCRGGPEAGNPNVAQCFCQQNPRDMTLCTFALVQDTCNGGHVGDSCTFEGLPGHCSGGGDTGECVCQ
jgi:hypothetical protein